MKHGMNTELFRAGGCPSSVAMRRAEREEASAPAQASAKPADRGGEFRPHPGPLPQERGLQLQPADHRFASASFLDHPSADRRQKTAETAGKCRGASAPLVARDSTAPAVPPSPGGEGRGEGEETLRKPARLRTADGVDHSQRRKTKLHARQGAESLTVASGLPPHPAPLPQGEGTPHPALRRVEGRRIGESAADGPPSPGGEGRGEGGT